MFLLLVMSHAIKKWQWPTITSLGSDRCTLPPTMHIWSLSPNSASWTLSYPFSFVRAQFSQLLPHQKPTTLQHTDQGNGSPLRTSREPHTTWPHTRSLQLAEVTLKVSVCGMCYNEVAKIGAAWQQRNSSAKGSIVNRAHLKDRPAEALSERYL